MTTLIKHITQIVKASGITGCLLLLLNYSFAQANKNYVRTADLLAPEQNANNVFNKWVADAKVTTQYIDGLGRPIQTVVKQASLQSGNSYADMVGINVYDEFGREAIKYLPFAANNAGGNTAIANGMFKDNPLAQQAAFCAAQYPGETHFYSKTNFEASPLNRVTEVYAPGSSWAGSETNTNPALKRNVQSKYFVNTANDAVRIWNVANNANVGSFGTYSTTAVYPAGELYKTIITDEHKKQVIEFKDKEGKVILKKVQLTAADDNGTGANETGWLCTYYVYDDFRILRVVIQPEGVKKLLESNWQLSTTDPFAYNTLLAEQCFRYEYDGRGRMIVKKVPGAGEVYLVYDDKDRLILTQDANMRTGTIKWMYTKYDELNRPIATGLWPSALTQQQHASNAANNLDYPILSSNEELIQTFYDDYAWMSAVTGLQSNYSNIYDVHFQPVSNTTWPYPQANVPSSQTKTMVTGSRTKILGTTTYLYSVVFYDDKGRTIQSQSTNITGGVDVVTTQYSWAGQPLIMVNKQTNAAGTPQTTVTVTQLIYDDLWRVVKTLKKLSHNQVNGGAMAAYKTIAENKYDKLGQLVNKALGTKPNSNNSERLAKLAQEYNVRGWLTAINKNFVTAGAAGQNTDEYFGMQLGYDKDGFGSFTKKQYNGNMAGNIWRSLGDGVGRKYDYDYDAANRLLKADFTQHDGTAFAINANINFNVLMGNNGTDPNSAYDYNGNILKMQQWGLRINNSEQIDNLVYEYKPGSNKMAKVSDVGTVATYNGKLGDFKDGTNANDDYEYDVNGNLNLDNNKAISNITYNHLNLPQVITITGKGNITYTYDAAGNKLKKVTIEDVSATKTITTTTDYINGLVYESKATVSDPPDPNDPPPYSNILQFVPHEVGRIRYKSAEGTNSASFAYDYMLKDHLGNIRAVITEEQRRDVYPAATLEPALQVNENKYYSIDQTKIVPNSAANYLRDVNNNAQTYQNNNAPIANNNPSCGSTGNLCSTALSENVYQLNSDANKTGLGITLKVMAGDKLDVFGKSYYFTNTAGTGGNSPINVVNILNGFLGGATGATATGVHGTVTATQIDPGSNNATLNSFFTTQTNQSAGTPNNPKAFINVLFFDEQFKVVDYKLSKVGNLKELKNHFTDLQNLVANKNGYVYIYCSNESPVSVFFDNIQVVHTRSALLEETHYYPFGLTMAGISSKAAGGFENKRKWNAGSELQSGEFSDGSGLELYSTFYRSLDPQLGRFWQIDPKPNNSVSLYSSMENNPIRYVDPLGDTLALFRPDGTFWKFQDDGKKEFSGLFYQTDKVTSYTDANGNKIERHEYSDGKAFEFNDPKTDVLGIKNGAITRIELMSESKIENSLIKSGVYSKAAQARPFKFANNAGRSGSMDYGMAGIFSNDPGTMLRSNTFYLRENFAYNVGDIGNYLWGRGMAELGINLAIAQSGAHVNNMANGRNQKTPYYDFGPGTYGRSGVFDSNADQQAIQRGYLSSPKGAKAWKEFMSDWPKSIR
jgi:RHS repeat-associated protein